MSDLGIGDIQGSHRIKHRHGRGCVAVLVALGIIAAIAVFAYVKGVDLIQGAISGPEDYSGDGSGRVTIQVRPNETGGDIAMTLFKADVVKSEEAFVDAYNENPDATSITPGSYNLRQQMSAESAVELLLNPESLNETPTVTITEGVRALEILDSIVEQTNFSKQEVEAAFADIDALELPDYAHGDPEGYLYPSTYDLEPKMTAADLLKTMVDEFEKQADKLGLEAGARELGYSPHEIVTVASLVQAEAGPADMKKVASVVYNRLELPMRLQFDSTLHYAVDSRGEVVAGDDLRKIDSPYNTYKRDGLPPTPIDSPGEEALTAALNPASTNFLYFVTVNLATQETRFTDSYKTHLRNVDVYNEYCETSQEC